MVGDLIKPKVSICIPVHNVQKYVATALDSALAQTYDNLEVIAVNDASSDGSRDVLRRYEGCVKVIDLHSGPRGASAARNRGFAEATGSRVLFLDADDVIKAEHVEALSRALDDAPPLSIAFSKWVRFHDSWVDAEIPTRPTDQNMDGVEWLIADWSDSMPMMQCGMFLMPRPLLETCGGWNENLTLFDDFEFFSRMISNSDGMVFASDACLYYRSGLEKSLSSRKSRPAVESQANALIIGTAHLLRVENSPRTRLIAANLLKQFDYEHYPRHADLRATIVARVNELGGCDLDPVGPPNFHRVRRITGWRLARLVQRLFGR